MTVLSKLHLTNPCFRPVALVDVKRQLQQGLVEVFFQDERKSL